MLALGWVYNLRWWTDMISLTFIGFTIDVIGKILVAYTALRVHYIVREEHKIDKVVFRTMRKEHRLGLIGIGLILLGYFLQVPGKLS